MAQVPVIVPMIVTGIILGYFMAKSGFKLTRVTLKKWILASIVAAIGNAAYAAALYMMTPSQIPSQRFPGAGQVSAGRPGLSFVPVTLESFVASSFVLGFLLVLGVVGVAWVSSRRFRKEVEDEGEP